MSVDIEKAEITLTKHYTKKEQKMSPIEREHSKKQDEEMINAWLAKNQPKKLEPGIAKGAYNSALAEALEA